MVGETLVPGILRWLAPAGTFRGKLAQLPKRFVRAVRTHGLPEALRRGYRKVHRRLIPPETNRLQIWYAEQQPSWLVLASQRRRKWPAHCPSIGIIVLAANTDKSRLRRTIASVRAQTYPHWEIQVVVDAGSTVPLRENDQIHRIELPSGANQQSGLNLALAATTDEYVAVATAGDVVSPNALFELADFLCANPACDMVYSDEDCVSGTTGRRHSLRLKPDWSPEMFLGHNYIGRLCLIRRRLLCAAGGFDSAFGEAQEYDACLRVVERTQKVGRVPKCLYHREAEPNGLDRSPPSARLNARAVQDHLRRRGYHAVCEAHAGCTHRIAWTIEDPPLVSIVIPTLNSLHVLRVCVDGLLHETGYPRKEIILVDNGSSDPAVHRYYDELTGTGLVRVVPYQREFNYSAACNVGARAARGDILLFLNNDIEVIHRDWLDEMVRLCLLPGVGCVGVRLLYPNGIVQHAGVVIGMHLTGLVYNRTDRNHRDFFGGSNTYRNVLAVMGACQMVRRGAFDAVGGFDERYRIAESDVAICLRLRLAGFRTVYTPHAELFHHEGYTRGTFNPTEDMELMARDIREMGIREDPYFHPALSALCSTPTLRLEPEPAPNEVLASQLDQLDPPSSREPRLDVFDDSSICAALGRHANHFALPEYSPEEVATCDRAATCFIIKVLRDSPELRKQFPRALSEGEKGGYCRWLCATAEAQFGLSGSAVERISEVFRKAPGNRIRQLYEFRVEVRHQFPAGMLPSGKAKFLAWLVGHAKAEHKLRDEEIWWFLIESNEDPLRELIYSYLVSPEWQANFPDALTEPGWPGFFRWACRRFGLNHDGIAEAAFVSPLPLLHQFRLAYDNRGQWRLRFPHAFQNRTTLQQLLDWLRAGAAGEQRDCASGWLERIAQDLSDPAEPRRGVNIIGHFNYPSGLQQSVQSVTESLRRMNVPVTMRDVPTHMPTAIPGRHGYLDLEVHDVTLIHVQPEPHWQSAHYDSGLHPARDRYRIGMWYWEFGEAPPEWRIHAETARELWAPTRFIARALEKTLPVPVYPMLPGVELGEVAVVPRQRYGLPDDKFLFLFMYDMNSMQERKNPLGVIAAFQDAFRRDDRVALAIKVARGSNNPPELARLNEAAKKAGVFVIDQLLRREEAQGLIQSCDCYVSLHRSEGLGLTLAEAMLMGKPVIATDYSGNVDFMTPDDSMLVGYRLIPLERDIPPFRKGYLWAEPSRSEAAHWMRWAYENQEAARELGRKGKVAAEAKLSMQAAGERMLTRLNEIWRRGTVARPPRKAA
jgi:GT2 family glycosyltransferase/glycosyltransferase involved in cell wall biosynthesis